MENNTKNSRVKQKNDIEANWKLAVNFIPLDGELIVYDVDENYSYPRFKVGNGVDYVKDLPFTNKPSDWNQNDETAPDYVKNRTHYEDIESEIIYNKSPFSQYYDSYYNTHYYFDSNDNGVDILYDYPIGTTFRVEIVGELDDVGTETYSFICTKNDESSSAYWDGGHITVDSHDVCVYHSSAGESQFSVSNIKITAECKTLVQLDEKYIPDTIARKSDVETAVNSLVDTAPEALNTLNELSKALGDDPNFATTVLTEVGKKVDKVDGKGLSTNDFTTDEKNKLAGIGVGAEKNVQPDWGQSDSTKDDFIKNKTHYKTVGSTVIPTIGVTYDDWDGEVNDNNIYADIDWGSAGDDTLGNSGESLCPASITLARVEVDTILLNSDISSFNIESFSNDGDIYREVSSDYTLIYLSDDFNDEECYDHRVKGDIAILALTECNIQIGFYSYNPVTIKGGNVNIHIPSAGLWITHGTQINNVTFGTYEYHTIDENYIPGTIARTSELDALEESLTQRINESGIDAPISSGTGKNSLIIGEGVASGDSAIAGGSTDKKMLESIVGGTVAALVTAKPSEASANMSLSFGANNKSITAGAGTVGFGNQGGVKGYYWDTIDFSTNTIKLSHNRRTTNFTSMSYVTDFDWAEGDIISMVNDNNYFARSVITSVNKANSTITVDSLPFDEIKYSTGLLDSLTLKPHDRTIFAVYQNDSDTIKTGKPRWVSRSGSVELGFGNFTLGVMNLNTGNASFTSGYNNWAGGAFGASIGRDNRSGYAAFAGGVETKADAYASIAYGLGLLNTSSSAAVFGQYNDITDIENMLLVIGCGGSDSNRKNALTVSRTGDVKARGSIYTNNKKVLTEDDICYAINPNGYSSVINLNMCSAPSNWNNEGDTVIGTEGADSFITNSSVATIDLTNLCAHDSYGIIRGGYPADYAKLGADTLSITTQSESDKVTRYKFLNTITNKATLDESDIGKKIKVSFNYDCSDLHTNPDASAQAVGKTLARLNAGFTVGVMSAVGNDYSSKFYTKAISNLKEERNDSVSEYEGPSYTVSFCVTIDQTMVENGIGLLTFNIAGGDKALILYGPITCNEMVPVETAVANLAETVDDVKQEVEGVQQTLDETLGTILPNKVDNARLDLLENPAAFLFEQDFSVVPDNWNNGKESADSYITNSSFHDFTGICGSSVNGALRGGSGIKTIEFTTFLDKTCFHIYATSTCRYKFFNTLTNKERLSQADLGRKVRITAKYFTAQGNSSIGLMSAKSNLYGQRYYKSFASQTAGETENWADIDVIVTIDQTIIDEGAALLTFDIGANSELYFTDIRCVELSSIEEIVEDIADITPDWNQNDETAPDYIKNRTHYTSYSNKQIILGENISFSEQINAPVQGTFYHDGLDSISYMGEIDIGDTIIIETGDGIFEGEIIYDSASESFISNTICTSGVIHEQYEMYGEVEMPITIKDNVISIICGYYSGEHIRPNIIVSKNIPSVKQLDEKYIPDTIARKTDVEELANSVNPINLFDGNYIEGIDIGGSTNSTTTASGMSYKTTTTPKRTSTIVLEVEPNTTYSIIKEKTGREGTTSSPYHYFKVAAATKLMTTNNEKFDGSFSYANTGGPTTNYTFTTGPNDRYVYIMTSINLKPFVQIVKGVQTEFTVSEYGSNYAGPHTTLNGKLNFYKWLDVNPRTSSNATSTSNNIDHITISNGRNIYTLIKDNVSSKNLNTWRWYNHKIDGGILWSATDDSYLWKQSDSEGVIKEVETDDFIGGFHGGEVCTGITILVDGEIIPEGEFTIRHDCKNITLIVKSNVYYCGTTTTAFNRTKKLEFTDSKVNVYNTWTYVGERDFYIDRSTLGGMYSVRKQFLNGISGNSSNEYITSVETTTDSIVENWSSDLDKVTFYGKEFTLTLQSLTNKTDHYRGAIQDFGEQGRYKVYFDDVSNVAGDFKLSTGDTLKGAFEIETHCSNNSLTSNATKLPLINSSTGSTSTLSVEIPLPTSGWSYNSSTGYYQTIQVPGIIESDSPIVDVVLSNNRNTNMDILTAWENITRITTQNGYITAYAEWVKPTTDITIQLKVIR